MKLLIRFVCYLMFPLLLTSCKSCKEKPEPAAEANLVVSLDPAPSSPTTNVVTLGTTYDFKVKIDSQMPAQGVDITVTYKKDSDNSLVSADPHPNVTTTQVQVHLANIPFNEVGTVTVVVTSKTKPDNTVTKTFKLVRK